MYPLTHDDELDVEVAAGVGATTDPDVEVEEVDVVLIPVVEVLEGLTAPLDDELDDEDDVDD